MGQQEPDPTPETTAEEVLAALRERYRDAGGSDNRRHERYAWTVPLSLTIEETGDSGVDSREVVVTTHDISLGGFAFIARSYVHPGSVISARFDTLPGKPRLVGVVRNCIHLSGALHRVGVQFTAKET